MGLSHITNALSGLDNDEKAECTINTLSSNGTKQGRKVIIINESGLYNLIFRSRKTEAKAFKKWVTSEVLPAIRKNGQYSTNAQNPVVPANFGKENTNDSR